MFLDDQTIKRFPLIFSSYKPNGNGAKATFIKYSIYSAIQHFQMLLLEHKFLAVLYIKVVNLNVIQFKGPVQSATQISLMLQILIGGLPSSPKTLDTLQHSKWKKLASSLKGPSYQSDYIKGSIQFLSKCVYLSTSTT